MDDGDVVFVYRASCSSYRDSPYISVSENYATIEDESEEDGDDDE